MNEKVVLSNGFCEMTEDEMLNIEGGFEIFGCSLGGLASGTFAGAAVGATIGGPVGFVVGAVVCAGVTYWYDSL